MQAPHPERCSNSRQRTPDLGWCVERALAVARPYPSRLRLFKLLRRCWRPRLLPARQGGGADAVWLVRRRAVAQRHPDRR
jgi:hypothetical protein